MAADPETAMREAIALASTAADAGEVPIGCVVVHEPTGRVIGRGYNRREADRDPTAHAEILAMREAGRALGHWRLVDCTLVVTLEPCPMCAGAIVQARIPRVIFGTTDPKAGACTTLYRITDDPRLNHRCTVLGGVLQEECRGILQQFFTQQRARGKK
jgi:tRNA(adenine34) deaminase